MHTAIDLAKAEQDVADAKERIERQRALISDLEHRGARTVEGRELLATMLDTLVIFEEHRDIIAADLRHQR